MHRAPAIVFLFILFAVSLFTVIINTEESVTNYKLAKENRVVKVMLLGDVMLGRSVNTRSLNQGYPVYPFEKVSDRLNEADIVFANLESPFYENCPRTETGMIFCADPELAEGLVYSGIDVVTLENNHILNYGKAGENFTKEKLEEKGVKWVNRSTYEIIEKDGMKFGFLGFNFVGGLPKLSDYELVKKADKEADVLIVGIHWGAEYRSRSDSIQKEIAEKLFDSGADVIAGHHPHWVQNIECFEKSEGIWISSEPAELGCPQNSKIVYYSLGNFIFDQMWSENTKKGLAVELTFRDGNIIKEERSPVYMKNWAQPEWVSN